MSYFLCSLGTIGLYVLFALYRTGFFARVPLALSRIALERIPVEAARRYGDKPLFETDDPVRWQVPQLAQRYCNGFLWTARRVDETAGYLAGLLAEVVGIDYGDRVAVVKQNHFDMQVLMLGAIRAGGVGCPLNGDFPAEKLDPYLTNIGATVFVTDVRTLERLIAQGARFGRTSTVIIAEAEENRAGEEAADLACLARAAIPKLRQFLWIEKSLGEVSAPLQPVRRTSRDPMYLTHSSGTTGFPKAVILSNGGQSHAARGMVIYSVLAKKDKAYVLIPFNHQACVTTLNTALIAGVQTYWASRIKFEFNARKTLSKLAADGFAAFFSFPFAYVQMADEDLGSYDLSRIKIWGCTADACHEVLQRKFVQCGRFFKSFGIPIRGSLFVDAQGSSEVGTPSVMRYITTLTQSFERRVGRWGSVPFGPRIRVLRFDGSPARKGEVGRLYVRGKTVTPGYWNNHEQTYATHNGDWFFTGDIVQLHKDGNLVQLDREVDVIHTAKGQVYSLLVEEVVHKHTAVFDCCVYGARQDDGTQLPAVTVALRRNRTMLAEVLRSELNAMLPASCQLSRVDIVPYTSFPLGVTGKTLKRTFRDRTERGEIVEQNRPIFAQ